MENCRSTRIIHLPQSVGRNAYGLSSALNQLGFKSQVWIVEQNYLGYDADKILFEKSDSLIWREVKRLWALSYVFRAEIVFFNFGQTLFQQLPKDYGKDSRLLVRIFYHLYRVYAHCMQSIELSLLRAQNRILLVQYQGDDARQGEYLLNNFKVNIADQVGSNYYPKSRDALKRDQIKRITGYCHKVYALNPDLLHVLPQKSEFLPYSHISIEEWSPVYTQTESRPLRIGHAPSNRDVKGTGLILNAIRNLQKSGFEFELVLIEGHSHAEAREYLKKIDVLVDQLFAGWYGGVAVEAMALGKPVLAYIRDEDLKFVPSKMASDLPIVRATPDTIQSSLQEVLEMPRAQLLELARQSRAYVERWHNPNTIAEKIQRDIETALIENNRKNET